MRKLLLLSVALFGFSAPAMADPISDFNTFLAQVQTITTTDLQAALADATAHNDAAAMQCYSGVLAYNAANPLQVPNIPAPVGVVSSFQLARDGVKFAEANQNTPIVPPAINQACGYLALDVQADVAKVGSSFVLFGIKF